MDFDSQVSIKADSEGIQALVVILLLVFGFAFAFQVSWVLGIAMVAAYLLSGSTLTIRGVRIGKDG